LIAEKSTFSGDAFLLACVLQRRNRVQPKNSLPAAKELLNEALKDAIDPNEHSKAQSNESDSHVQTDGTLDASKQ